jgi:tRNA pseudouridine38-40 synthase
VRTVHSVTLTQEDPLLQGAGYYRVDFRIDSAIYRMIRNLVGAGLCVASGDMGIDAMRQLLADAPFRVENKAMSAPACGLTLEHVFYDHY